MRRSSVPLENQPELAVRLCQLLGLELKARFEDSGDAELFPNRIVLEGPDAQWLMANRGQGLDALQYLLHEAHGEREEHLLAYLDVQKARLFRMKELVAMTGFAMDRARATGRHTLNSLNPRERRWVHLLVAREQDLVSESEGTGNLKALRIQRKP